MIQPIIQGGLQPDVADMMMSAIGEDALVLNSVSRWRGTLRSPWCRSSRMNAILITVDFERDTSDAWSDYAPDSQQQISSRMGRAEQIAKTAGAVRPAYGHVEGDVDVATRIVSPSLAI